MIQLLLPPHHWSRVIQANFAVSKPIDNEAKNLVLAKALFPRG
jgi:hypothetical protein